MRNRIVPLLVLVIVSANLRADAIRYDQIPADAISYIHFDADRFLACRALKEFGAPADLAAKVQEEFGGKIGSFTIYFCEDNGSVRTVILVHADAGVRTKAEAFAGKAKDKVVIKYEEQEIYYSSDGLLALAEMTMGDLGQDQEEKVLKRMPDGSLVPETKEEPDQKNRGGFFSGHGSFMLGVGDKPTASDMLALNAGPSYRAFVGQDLLVMTTDIRSMSKALDVVKGRKASLTKENPRGLMGDIPTGAIFMGAGLTAQLTGDSLGRDDKQPGSSTRPSTVIKAGSGPFGLDMFGSFKGKAQLARFAVGEDAETNYVDASITMADGEIAEQLKNLMIGVKALVSLSQARQAPLIEPLQIRAGGKEVGLHWSWPTAKLSELVKLVQDDGDGNASTSPSNSKGSR